MEIFLFRFDNSRPLKQVFWFVIMLFPLLGAALYCFVVYSRSNVFKAGDQQAHRAPSMIRPLSQDLQAVTCQ